ncbi:amino acid adenylation domain-containing protein [Reyranella sp.]|uniref:amino acid adenylation domain-containing protein n=1 Tax=Reyranella sp. TaxID=1929291 RepID=UPI00378417E7
MAGFDLGAAPSALWQAGGNLDCEIVAASITRRFAAIAQGAASAVAVVQGDEALAYATLDRCSNQLARVLLRQGVGPGSVVAVYASRSIGALTSLLAILKTGAAYAPLDAAAPAEYRDWVLRDCGARLLLTDRRLAGSRPVLTIDIDAALAAAEADSGAPLEDCSSPADIAYVMYTSGSTGRPKGVQIPHRAVVRLVVGQDYARFAADEVFLHAAALSFDASTFEIFGALLHGARLAVVDGDHASLDDIATAIARHRVTTAWFTAGLFHLLVEQRLAALAGLRQILAGGDVLSPSHVLRAQAALPDCQLINGYGPTENTTFTCCYRVPRDGWGGGPVPIGTPIRGTHVRLLDDDMKPVADGETGMLFAGGLGVASGYLGEARHSATSFVADPEHRDAVLYRTGDLARRRADGAFDFLGRQDRQVKIDGKRVEPGEIEDALRRVGAIANAVVAVGRALSGEPALTAYVTPAPGSIDRAALISEVRSGLELSLPAYMRPSQIVVLEEFPLTPNGKVDHARLPAPEPVQTGPAPVMQEGAESVLSGIVSRVLGVAALSPDTNFFDLGATSLKLMEAHAAIERIWPEVGIVELFRQPTIRGLARAIERRSVPADAAPQRRGQQQAEALRRLQRARTAR